MDGNPGDPPGPNKFKRTNGAETPEANSIETQKLLQDPTFFPQIGQRCVANVQMRSRNAMSIDRLQTPYHGSKQPKIDPPNLAPRLIRL
jgi:hypothetical protein